LKKKTASPWFQFLFIVLYLIFGSLFFKIYNDQNFWLPDNGNGGFLGAYVLKFLSMLKDQFKIIALASLVLSAVFFILSLGLSFSNWKTILATICKPIYFLKTIVTSRSSNIEDRNIDSLETDGLVKVKKKILLRKHKQTCLCKKALKQNCLSIDYHHCLF